MPWRGAVLNTETQAFWPSVLSPPSGAMGNVVCTVTSCQATLGSVSHAVLSSPGSLCSVTHCPLFSWDPRQSAALSSPLHGPQCRPCSPLLYGDTVCVCHAIPFSPGTPISVGHAVSSSLGTPVSVGCALPSSPRTPVSVCCAVSSYPAALDCIGLALPSISGTPGSVVIPITGHCVVSAAQEPPLWAYRVV